MVIAVGAGHDDSLIEDNLPVRVVDKSKTEAIPSHAGTRLQDRLRLTNEPP